MNSSCIPRENYFIFIRYIAAFSILFSHSRIFSAQESYNEAVALLTWLFPGVPTLFLISGFLVSLSHNGEKFNAEYLIKRILRVFPPLWASVLLTTIALFSVGYISVGELNWGEFSFWLVGQLTVLQIYHPSFLDDFGIGVINGSLWAIVVIFQFYLVLPLLIKTDQYCSQKYSENWIYVLMVVFALINICFHYFNNFHQSIFTKALFFTLIPWGFNFILGYVFQRNFHKIKNINAYTFLFWLGLHITTYLTLKELGFRWGRNDINPLLLVVFASAIIHAAFLPKINNITFNKVESFLRKYDITFGMFVYHMVILNFILNYNIFESNFIMRLITLIVVTIIVASFSMFIIEKPIKDNRNIILTNVLKCWFRLKAYIKM